MSMKEFRKKPGFYEPFVHDKENQTQVVKKGKSYWTVTIEEGVFYDTKNQDAAQCISMLAKIMHKLGIKDDCD